ncbi:MAG: hypothetical protein B7X37_00820 [Halothiobacillus sp. 14-55-98]|nr:MAG: hypothetical protein B7X37_00820 [Halothiobacillus sp. 14-55-98]
MFDHHLHLNRQQRLIPFWASMLLTLFLFNAPIYAQTATAAQDRVVAQNLMNDLADSSWIQDGTGSKIVYLFFDPNCPYCHHVFDSLMKIRKDSPDLQFRWIPLGMLGSNSTTKAAAIIQAPDPLKAFMTNEKNYGFLNSDTGGGIPPAKQVDAESQTILDENLSILQGQNLYGIPVVVFQADDGKPFYFSGQRSEAQLREILAHVVAGSFGGGQPIKGQQNK